MDGSSLALIVSSITGVLVILVGAYAVLVKNGSQIKVDDATLIRSNLIPTSEWLRREQELNERMQRMEERIDKQREDYEKRLVEKDKTIDELTREVKVLTLRTDEQDKIIEDLQKQITHNNV